MCIRDSHREHEICNRLGRLYYQVREGIGFNKTPSEYGAVPTDPYSHTPKHAGAQQPGMTGQVKEEIVSRFGELGVRVKDGSVCFQPSLLRECEFSSEENTFRYLDVEDNWQSITVRARGLAFSWCQVPVVYQLVDDAESTVSVTWQDGSVKTFNDMLLPADESAELFRRSNHIRLLTLSLSTKQLFRD